MSVDDAKNGSLSDVEACPGGLYVTVEGIDGCGKSTLVESLKGSYPDAFFTEEPKSSVWTGKAVRKALVSDTGPYTDALLFMADRAEHLHEFVKPALSRGQTVISDRSADSTYAYQSGRIDAVDAFSWFDACYEPWDVEPDLTIWLDIDPEIAIERVEGREKYERIEKLKEVRDNYELMNTMHDRYRRVDAEQPPGDVLGEAIELIEEALK